MQIEIVTLFPKMFDGILAESMVKRGVEAGVIGVGFVDLRQFGSGKHQVVDDRPYGGGPGMLLKAKPLVEAIEAAQDKLLLKTGLALQQQEIIYLCPQGRPYVQRDAKELSQSKGFVLVCGHYEGIDERVRELKITREISMGDFVLSGGEIAAMAVVDSVARLIPGVLGDLESTREETFEDNLLEYPQYTRPLEYRGLKVPDVLLSGHHGQVEAWRTQARYERTEQRRPDLLQKRPQ